MALQRASLLFIGTHFLLKAQKISTACHERRTLIWVERNALRLNYRIRILCKVSARFSILDGQLAPLTNYNTTTFHWKGV